MTNTPPVLLPDAPREIVLITDGLTTSPSNTPRCCIALRLTLERINAILNQVLPLPPGSSIGPDPRSDGSLVSCVPNRVLLKNPYRRLLPPDRMFWRPVTTYFDCIGSIQPLETTDHQWLFRLNDVSVAVCPRNNKNISIISPFYTSDLISARLLLTPNTDFPAALVHFSECAPHAVSSCILDDGFSIAHTTVRHWRPLPLLDERTITALLSSKHSHLRQVVLTHLIPKVERLQEAKSRGVSL